MKTLLPFLLGITLLIQACSPEPVYRLQAQANDETTFYYQGKEYIHLSQDSIDVIVSYFEHTSSMFAVDVEIINNSNKIIRVSPDSFSYKSYTGLDPKNPKELRKISKAQNPEEKILNLDMALSKQKARQQGDEFLFLAMQGLNLAQGITADTKKEQEKAGEAMTETAIHQEVDRANYRTNRSGLKGSRKFWQVEALRITDLWPGESIRGLVYFNTDKKAWMYQILMNITAQQFDVWFSQKKHFPQHSIDQMD